METQDYEQNNGDSGKKKLPKIKKPNIKKPKIDSKVLILIAILALGLIAFNMFRKPYDKPEIKTIKSNETAFLVSVTGSTDTQKKFDSEADMLRELVREKDVRIPHYWLQTGRLVRNGEWRAQFRLLIIDRTPVTREWVNGLNGTNKNADEAIKVEAKDSITFFSGMNCTAMIKESDAVKYRFNYGERPLAAIMDSEIRPMVESLYAEIAGTMVYEEVIASKDSIISYIRTGREETPYVKEQIAEYDESGNEIRPYIPAKLKQMKVKGVVEYFKDRGITITVLGMKGGLTPENSEIQKSIDEKFKAEKEYQTQQARNKKNIEQLQSEAEAKLEAQRALNTLQVEKAEAEAQSVKIKASVLEQELKIKQMEVMIMSAQADLERAKNWNGDYPSTLVTDAKNANMFLGLPGLTGGAKATDTAE